MNTCEFSARECVGLTLGKLGEVALRDGGFNGKAHTMTPTGTVIDGTGKWVTPGIFSAVTDLGLSDVDGVETATVNFATKKTSDCAINCSDNYSD